jgi:hypothetical protein
MINDNDGGFRHESRQAAVGTNSGNASVTEMLIYKEGLLDYRHSNLRESNSSTPNVNCKGPNTVCTRRAEDAVTVPFCKALLQHSP